MPANPSVPDIPSDWEQKEQDGTPYLLGIAAGDTAWRPVLIVEPVVDEAGAIVTSANARPVFIA